MLFEEKRHKYKKKLKYKGFHAFFSQLGTKIALTIANGNPVTNLDDLDIKYYLSVFPNSELLEQLTS